MILRTANDFMSALKLSSSAHCEFCTTLGWPYWEIGIEPAIMKISHAEAKKRTRSAIELAERLIKDGNGDTNWRGIRIDADERFNNYRTTVTFAKGKRK